MPYNDRAEVNRILLEVRRAAASEVEREIHDDQRAFGELALNEGRALRRVLSGVYLVPLLIGLLLALFEVAQVSLRG